jgi:arylsulfatase A-like enzyme
MTASPAADTRSPLAPALLLLALWFALAAGLLEGLVKWLLPVFGLAGHSRFCLGDMKVLWAPVTVDLAFFLFLGLLLILLSLLARRLPWTVIAAGLFAALTSYGILSAAGRLRERGAIVLAIGLGVVIARWMKRNPPARLGLLRRSFAPLAIVVGIACLGPWPAAALLEKLAVARAPEPQAHAPSVLLIVLDTVRADRLSAYGYARPTTPFLDELAQQGVLFERAFANSSWSLPSHVSLMTGRLPGEHGGATIGESFDGRFPTLAQALAQRGYATAAFVANAGYASCARGLGLGFHRYEDSFAPASQIMDRVYAAKLNKYIFSRFFDAQTPREWHTAAQINRAFLDWAESAGGRPFFAFLNFMETHYPYAPPADLARRFSSDLRPVRPEQWHPMRNGGSLDPALVQRASDHYDAALADLDAQLRSLFAELDRRGLRDNLLVVITSDHGESFGEHGLLEHQISLYRDQIHVPLLLRLPGRTPAGARVSAPVGLNQVAATVAVLAGLQDHPFPGLALDTFWGGAAPESPAVISEVAGGPWPGVARHWPIYEGPIRSLVTDRWHLLLTGNGQVELYDWSADPREERNLAAEPVHQQTLAELRTRLEMQAKP